MLPSFFDSVLQLIVRTSTDLPPDVRAAMKIARSAEPEGTRASQALTIIAQNIDLAADGEGAICQDTGMPTFEVRVPVGANQIWMRQQIREAVAEATRRGKLRPNSVDSITGKNSGDNLGPGTPIIHFDQWDKDQIEIKLILKGGGCENTNAQYSVPVELPHLGRADRKLDGVKKCILHAVWQAQGKGCAPGAVGVCIGGDRTSGYLHAKEQLFRTLDDVNPDPRLAELEASIMSTVNTLEIGAMGFGGKVTLIGCKIGALNRLPASFFVSVAYDCWAFRRLGRAARFVDGRDRPSWLYRDPSHPIIPMLDQAGFVRTGREVALNAPLTEDAVRALKVGDVVMISGRMFTGRDAVHSHLMKNAPPVDLNGSVLYHCGPVVVKEGETLARHRRRTDDQHSRGAVSGRDHQALRRARRDRQGRDGREDAGRAEGARRGVPQRDRRRRAVLRARHRESRRRLAARVRHARSDVASDGEGFSGDRHDGRARQQPAQGHRAGIGRASRGDRSLGENAETGFNAEIAEIAGDPFRKVETLCSGRLLTTRLRPSRVRKPAWNVEQQPDRALCEPEVQRELDPDTELRARALDRFESQAMDQAFERPDRAGSHDCPLDDHVSTVGTAVCRSQADRRCTRSTRQTRTRTQLA